MKYKKGYKYQLVENFTLQIKIYSKDNIDTRYMGLTNYGLLTIKAGYAWDGPSGPTIDTKNFMRGSLVHDALYQLMRNSHISQTHRKYADRLLRSICREDGMSRARAWWVYQGVRFAGGASTDPRSKKKILTAP